MINLLEMLLKNILYLIYTLKLDKKTIDLILAYCLKIIDILEEYTLNPIETKTKYYTEANEAKNELFKIN